MPEEQSNPIARGVEEALAQWSFDLRKMHDHLGSEDEFLVVLRGHLYLEHVLIAFLAGPIRRI
jgi:hypothetical protein